MFKVVKKIVLWVSGLAYTVLNSAQKKKNVEIILCPHWFHCFIINGGRRLFLNMSMQKKKNDVNKENFVSAWPIQRYCKNKWYCLNFQQELIKKNGYFESPYVAFGYQIRGY